MATISLAVTVSNPGSGNKYYIDGVLQDTVNMTPGNTYQFDQSDTSNSGHPLRLSTTSDGTHNSGSEYTTGVTTNGTPGSAGAYTQIVVTASTVQTLYYYCSNHSGMGGSIVVGNASTLNYKNIAGFNIQNLSSDPVPYAQALADNPYAGVWSSGGNLNQARTYSGASGLGTQTDSLLFGGRKNSAPATNRAETEKYNGTAWTEVNDLPAAKEGVAGFGTTTNAVSAGGGNSPAVSNPTCTWDGTNWTEVNEINTSREKPKGAGTYTAGLIFSGNPFPSVSAATEEWDGTNWTNGGNLNTARSNVGNAGATQTAALAFGGGPPTSIGNTEEYNGTSWSEKADLNTTRGELGGLGTSTLALAIGGQASPGRVANTESFDGTSWTEVNDLGTARNNGSGSGTGTSGLLAGGNNPNESSATEEWTFSGLPPSTPAAGYSDAIIGQMYYNSTSGQFKAIKDGAGTWASGGNLNSGRNSGNITGSATSGMYAGGENPGAAAANTVENYDGTSWTEITEMGTARGRAGLTNTNGNSDVLLISGGASPLGSTNAINNVEKWNGSSWTEIAEVNTARSGGQAFGVTTASIFQGGYTPPGSIVANTEYWNGSSWTELNDMNTLRVNFANWGVYNSGGMAGGSSPTRTNHETWDGTSWTETTDINSGRSSLGGGGASSSSGIVFGGTEPGPSQTNKTEIWNGSTWTEVADMGQTAGEATGSSNSVSSALSKKENATKTQTEEWLLPDFEIKTMTTS